MKTDLFANRKWVVIAIFCSTAVVIIARLFYLQIIDDKLKNSATQNSTRISVIYPSRGLIYDRKHRLIVANKASYDLMVNMRDLKPFDTTELCSILNIDRTYLEKQFSRKHPNSFILVPLVSPTEYAKLQEKLYRYQGFYIQTRTIRSYRYNSSAHLLGYQNEVSNTDIDKDPYYQPGDYIGRSGIEKSYEKHLRGMKGEKHEIVDALGRTHGSANNGKDDIAAVNGADLTLSIDIELQQYIESLLKNKRASVIAIEPNTGEILAMASSPTYNPSTIEGRNRTKEFAKLNANIHKPQTNRAINGLYSPGSTFKMANALIALQEHAITPNTLFPCQGTSSLPIKCTHFHGSPNALDAGIENSCNPYFWLTFKAILNNGKGSTVKSQFKKWREYMNDFGFGVSTGVDIPFAKNGSIPTVEYYDKLYRGQWNALTVRSLAIGQGEVLTSPLQLANYMAIIANRGYYYPPHLVKMEGEKEAGDLNWKKRKTKIDSIYYEEVIKGLGLVYSATHGTAHWYINKDIAMAGKTGTVQNSHGKDHSIFVAFAPVDNPKIAICAVVENAGYGATWAAPLVTLSMEKYLTDTIPSYHQVFEKKLLTGNLMDE